MRIHIFWWGVLFGCSSPPDVIVVTIDTLRFDHVSAYGKNDSVRTPALEALAKDSVLYTQAYSPISVTGPALVSVMTGALTGAFGLFLGSGKKE